MRWTPGGLSSDVEDRRGDSGGGGFGGGGLGIVGFLVLLVLSLVTGRNFLGSFFRGAAAPTQQMQPAGAPRTHTAAEDRDAHLMSFTLDDVQKTWTGIMQQKGRPYRHAKLVIY